MPASERQRELKRRRHRKKKIAKIAARVGKASASEKLVLAHKIRGITPAAEVLIARLGLAET